MGGQRGICAFPQRGVEALKEGNREGQFCNILVKSTKRLLFLIDRQILFKTIQRNQPLRRRKSGGKRSLSSIEGRVRNRRRLRDPGSGKRNYHSDSKTRLLFPSTLGGILKRPEGLGKPASLGPMKGANYPSTPDGLQGLGKVLGGDSVFRGRGSYVPLINRE